MIKLKELISFENPINTKLRIHLSKNPIKRLIDKPVQQISSKPTGFWYGFGREWIRFIHEREYKWKYGDLIYFVKILKPQKILKISNKEQLLEFSNNEKYMVNTNTFSPNYLINWKFVALDYSGIEINPHIKIEHKDGNKVFWYDNWDVASGCIWDTSIIELRQIYPKENQPKIIKENSQQSYHSAILTNNPAKLYFEERHEGRHIDILIRLFPSVLKIAEDFEKKGYGGDDEEGENEALYKAANYFCEKNNIARVVIEKNVLFFNTSNHKELSYQQMKLLKDYCIENGIPKLIHSMGRREKEIELYD